MTSPNDQNEEFHFTLDAERTAGAAEARHLARQHFDFEDDDVEAVHLVAFSEIVQNAIHAHLHDGIEQPIEVTFTADPPMWSVVDHARGFDIESVLDKPPPPTTAASGRGLLIAKAFVPAIQIQSGLTGTTVRLPLSGARWVRLPDA